MNRNDAAKKLALLRQKRIRAARRDFWEYCKLESPDFYLPNRWHLQLFCWVLQALYERRLTKAAFKQVVEEIAPGWYIKTIDWSKLRDNHIYTKLMSNLPPRLGKSRTLVNFCKWCLGQSIENKIITASYNDDTAQEFSRYTRDGIAQTKVLPHEIIYNDIFPDSKIKQGDAAYHKWALEGNFFNYLGAGVNGSVTGKGCNISIVDDPIKDAAVAMNEGALQKIWKWYTGTFLSRLEEKNGVSGIEIVNMTRWAKGDICGQILDNPIEAQEWFIFSMEAMDEKSGQMLCDGLLSKKRYESLKRNILDAIFNANYHQKPIDLEGCLYKEFKFYDDIPRDEDSNPLFEAILNYTDTADEGKDYLSSGCAGLYQGQLYLLDVLYTKDGMEKTEPATAEMLVKNKVTRALIESNNGGRGFARNVQKIIWDKHKTRSVSVEWFHQSKNKRSRILSNATNVMNNIFMPRNANVRWPEFWKAITTYQKEGSNLNDDAEDMLTGLAEMLDTNNPNVRDL